MNEIEALRRFFLAVYPEARNAQKYYRARATGGMLVGSPTMPPSVADRIVREAEQLGLGVAYDLSGAGADQVTHSETQ